jgi:RNA polymerase sigma factor (sigma-70 family)
MEDALPELLARDLEAGFDGMVRAYQDRIYAFALGMTASSADAEEVAQDTFVRAYRALGTYGSDRRRELRLNAWLHRLALNVFRNRWRRRGPALVPLDGAPELAERAEEGPQEWVERADGLLRLGRLVTRLPEGQRAAVVLRCVEGLPYADVAEALGQPVGTVKSNVHRGLSGLRRQLGGEEE